MFDIRYFDMISFVLDYLFVSVQEFLLATSSGSLFESRSTLNILPPARAPTIPPQAPSRAYIMESLQLSMNTLEIGEHMKLDNGTSILTLCLSGPGYRPSG